MAAGSSFREIAKALGVGLGTTSEVVSRATRIGLTWNEVDAIGEDELEARMYPPVSTTAPRPEPNPAAIHIELRRTGVSLRLLHEEYVLAHPNSSPYGYTKFVELYNAWADRLKITMRQVHKAGEKCFVDYSGKRPSIVDAKTGERVEVELFRGDRDATVR
jgi:transposase